jgi:uncharacterized protein YukE
MVFDGLIQQVMERARLAAQARADAEDERRRRRRDNDQYVTGGVNWNGYGLEDLIKMVAEQANPGQLDALAGEWRDRGDSINRAAGDLNRSMNQLMQFWSGAAADDATRVVTRNVTWVNEMGQTAQHMADPIQDAGGALRSAQDTMPGKPSSAWWAGAGGGAAAGFAVGGPIGAAFGAAIGGIASAFGFGSNKKKLKRKAVQTMQRYEGALLGIDSTTPQFGSPSDGANPGIDPIRNPGVGVGNPTPGPTPPGGPGFGGRPVGPVTPPGGFDWTTNPSQAGPGTPSRWQGLTGLGPNIPGAGGGLGGGGLGGGGLGGLPLIPGGRGGPGGRGPGGRGLPIGGGLGPSRAGGDGQRRGRVGGMGPVGGGGVRGGQDGERRGGRGGRAGAGGPLGAGGARGAEDGEHRNRTGRGGASGNAGRPGYGTRGLGASALGADDEDERRNRGRFGRGGLESHGASGYGAPGGAGARKEEDEEHRRRFPVEEDPFTTDLKAAPPVIGL